MMRPKPGARPTTANHVGRRPVTAVGGRPVTTMDGTQRKEKRTSSLVAYGEPGGETAMARTVGITTAIAAELVLEGKVTQRGMLTPVAEEVYKPALVKLEKEGFVFSEQTVEL